MGQKGNMSHANGALYSFGHGLSYTTFAYSDLKVEPAIVTPNQSAKVSFAVKNTGDVAGDEVVQLYVNDVLSSVTTYDKVLRGGDRVHLKPGESKTVEFILDPAKLALLDRHKEWVVEPGDFKIMIGASSENIKLDKKLTVVDPGTKAMLEKKIDGLSNVLVASARQETAAHVVDGNTSTSWSAGSGEYITLSLVEGTQPRKMDVVWGAGTDAEFEIQVSGGGGQFLNMIKGQVQAKGNPTKPISYKFDGPAASDIRLLITKGKANVAEIKVAGFKGEK